MSDHDDLARRYERTRVLHDNRTIPLPEGAGAPATLEYPAVNSHDHWSTLDEVVVGDPVHRAYHDDLSFRLFYCANLDSEVPADESIAWRPPESTLERRVRAEMAEDLRDFTALLEREGVTVRSPDPQPAAVEVSTPDWTTLAGHSVMPRDLFVVIGDEIVETAPAVRSRYFEADLYHAMLTGYQQRGAQWTVAPRSRLRAENFDYSFALGRGYRGPVPAEPDYELMFDGAQLVRIGRDILFNCSTENHRIGLRWLARQLGDEYRVHEIFVTDNHVDTRIVPLRPGTLLLHEQVQLSQLPEFLRRWEIIRYASPSDTLDRTQYGPRPVLSSSSLGMNLLSLDERRIVVQHDQAPLIADLRRAGFEPIPCRWRHGRVTGGGFHCMTLDVRRRSVLTDYT